MKENGLTLKKSEAITDADFMDDLTLFAKTPTSAECLQHSLEQTAKGIGCHVNSDKIEFMFKTTTTLNYKPLKINRPNHIP